MADHPDERLKRDAFLYLDPKGNHDQFAQCNTCRDWIDSENRCLIHGPKVEVKGSMSCGFYIEGANNDVDATTVSIVTPEESGLVDREVRCENCRWFAADDGECDFFAMLNRYLPQEFDLDINVDAKGCCNANQAKEA